MLLGGGFAGLLVLLVTSIVIVETGVYPRWLAWLGLVAAIALLFDVLYLNILPFWSWVCSATAVRGAAGLPWPVEVPVHIGLCTGRHGFTARRPWFIRTAA